MCCESCPWQIELLLTFPWIFALFAIAFLIFGTVIAVVSCILAYTFGPVCLKNWSPGRKYLNTKTIGFKKWLCTKTIGFKKWLCAKTIGVKKWLCTKWNAAKSGEQNVRFSP